MSKMSIPQNIRSTETDSRLPEVLAAEDCRQTIQMLRGRKEAITEAELADQLATKSNTGATVAESNTMDALQVRLRHLYLPKLADVGLVDWDREAQTVSATDHPVYDAQQLDDREFDADRDSIATPPADGRQRQILAIVESENGSITREALARELAAAEANGQPTESLIDNIAVQLHHSYLPKLVDAGHLQYNRDDGTVAYHGPLDQIPAPS